MEIAMFHQIITYFESSPVSVCRLIITIAWSCQAGLGTGGELQNIEWHDSRMRLAWVSHSV